MSSVLKLDRKLKLQEVVLTADGAGGFATDWTTVGTLWGHVKSSTARERLIGGREVTRANYRITVRAAPVGASSRPVPEQRFLDGTRAFNIHAVTEANDTPHFLVCWVSEGTQE